MYLLNIRRIRYVVGVAINASTYDKRFTGQEPSCEHIMFEISYIIPLFYNCITFYFI